MDKRAHHNALERKRRDHIKDSFTGLRDAIPTMRGGDKSSRAQILKKASEYIQVYKLIIRGVGTGEASEARASPEIRAFTIEKF